MAKRRCKQILPEFRGFTLHWSCLARMPMQTWSLAMMPLGMAESQSRMHKGSADDHRKDGNLPCTGWLFAGQTHEHGGQLHQSSRDHWTRPASALCDETELKGSLGVWRIEFGQFGRRDWVNGGCRSQVMGTAAAAASTLRRSARRSHGRNAEPGRIP